MCQLLLQRSADVVPAPNIDVLALPESDVDTDGAYVDDLKSRQNVTVSRNGDGGSPATSGTGSPPPAAAVPTNLQQIDTGWVGGNTSYGFQVKFRVSSSSGATADLRSQPTLKWREYVTYSHNDFAHRISPPNPTILPPGAGVSFAPGRTTMLNPNSLEFNGVTDTHHTPTSAVRGDDFLPPSGTHALPAVMSSSQVYQFTTDGSAWTTFAGPFSLTRTLARAPGAPTPNGRFPLMFTTKKSGIRSLTEMYKP